VRFTQDRRLKELAEWLKTDVYKVVATKDNGNQEIKYEINRAFLEKEFEYYEKDRLEILKEVHDFEKLMFREYSPELNVARNQKGTGQNYFDFDLMLDVFYEKHTEYAHEKGVAKNVRNKFSHNQFPDKNVLIQHPAFKEVATQYDEHVKLSDEREAALKTDATMPDDDKKNWLQWTIENRSVSRKITHKAKLLFRKYRAELTKAELTESAIGRFAALCSKLKATTPPAELAKFATALAAAYPAADACCYLSTGWSVDDKTCETDIGITCRVSKPATAPAAESIEKLFEALIRKADALGISFLD